MSVPTSWQVSRTRPTVVIFHANAGNMGHRLPLAKVFWKQMGCNVFLLSYRGCVSDPDLLTADMDYPTVSHRKKVRFENAYADSRLVYRCPGRVTTYCVH